MNNKTFPILRIIGSPFAKSNPDLDNTNADYSELYQYAEKNRMRLLYLDALKRHRKLGSLEEEHEALSNRYSQTVEAFSRLGKTLDNADVNYAFFKTVRPYREVTVDMDVLIFDTSSSKINNTLSSAGYKLLNNGHISSTFHDDIATLNVDIYDEVGASRMIYLDKNKVRDRIIDRLLPNGDIVRSLDLSADILAVISHSVVKEHMYVLSEYYTTLYYLDEMDSHALDLFPSLVEECYIHSAVKTHLGITALLHYKTHGSIPNILSRLLSGLGIDNFESVGIEESNFMMPYKYHLLTISKVLIEKLGEKKAKKSFAFQLSSMLNPQFSSIVLRETIRRRARESY